MILSVALPAIAPARRLPGVSPRDRLILSLVARRIGTTRLDFSEALRALSEATAELIPAGRIFLLGEAENGRIVGSLVSGVGLTEGTESILIVRVQPAGSSTTLGRLGRLAP